MTSGDNSSTVIDELTKRLRANQIGYEDAYQAAIESADLIEWQAAEILNIRSRADRQASTIASLYQAKASLEREVSRLARQPAAIDKQCTCKGVLGHSRQCAMFDESMMSIAAPIANEANKPAPSVEQDERGAFAKWFRDEVDKRNLGPGDETAALSGWQARAASTSANGDRFDPYRLKVAEECCERLMSACTDAGCPDGVRMDDWIRENIRSTSTNVAQGAEADTQSHLTSNAVKSNDRQIAPTAQIGTSDEADFERGTWTFRMRPGFIVTAGEYLIVQKRQPAEGGDADPL